VLYIALEEKMDRMVLRAEQQMAGAEKSQIVNQDMSLNNKVYDAIQNHYQKNRKLLGDFYISKHMPGEVITNKLEQIIVNTTIKKDKNIDVIIIDYHNIMRNTKAKYHSESVVCGKIYEENIRQ